MKPVIGIVGRPTNPEEKSRLFVTENCRKSLIKAGAIPIVILPVQNVDYNSVKGSDLVKMNLDEKMMLDTVLKLCDGIVMPGGYRMFEHDFYILEYAIKNDIPIMGICLGMQIMACYGEIKDNLEMTTNNHFKEEEEYVHGVTLKEKSKLANIILNKDVMVNSMHNYTVKSTGIYDIVAFSDDGIVEAIEHPNCGFNIGVQWHPEVMYSYDENARKLINSFVDICNNKKEY